MSTLERLEQRRDVLEGKLAGVYRAISEEMKRIAYEEYGVTVGSIVTDGQCQFRVTEVDAHCGGKPWVSVNPRRKDGTFGTAHRHLYNWELVPNNEGGK